LVLVTNGHITNYCVFCIVEVEINLALHVSEGGKAGGQGASSIRVISGESPSRDMMGQAGIIALEACSGGFEDELGMLEEEGLNDTC
jgi:hypothetical protein